MAGHRGDDLAVHASLQSDRQPDHDLEGVVVAGSWNPATATIQVVLGDTYAIANDGNGDQFAILTATVGTTYNDQYGPVGGERVHLQRAGGGWVAHFEHADDDTLHAPAGERWIAHRHPSTGAIDAYIKLTNDGATASDGLAGLKVLVGALLTMISTGGLKIVISDHDNAIELAGASATAAVALMRASDVQSALSSFQSAMVTAAVPNAGSIVVPTVGSGVSGSSKVFSG